MSIFVVFGLTGRGIEPESTVSVADALSTRRLIGYSTDTKHNFSSGWSQNNLSQLATISVDMILIKQRLRSYSALVHAVGYKIKLIFKLYLVLKL